MSNNNNNNSTENFSNPNNFQINRFDGKNCFFEVMSGSFNINKVRMNFREYDSNKAPKDRITKSIDIYMDIDKFLLLSQDVLSGKLEALRKSQEHSKYLQCIWFDMGGTTSEKLKERNQSRPDGLSISRQFKIMGGRKFILQAEEGAGEKSETGLIVPKYGNSPEQLIKVALSGDDIKRFVLLVKAHIESYLQVKYRNYI